MKNFKSVIATIRNGKSKLHVQEAIEIAREHVQKQLGDKPSLDYFNQIVQAALVAACNTRTLNQYLEARFGIVHGIDKAGQPIYRLPKGAIFKDTGTQGAWFEYNKPKTDKAPEPFSIEKFLQGGARKGGVEVAVLQAYIRSNAFKNEVAKAMAGTQKPGCEVIASAKPAKKPRAKKAAAVVTEEVATV